MALIQLGKFTSSSSRQSILKIECDTLTGEDWANIAILIGTTTKFCSVEGTLEGGLPLAQRLIHFETGDPDDPHLIVDGVLSTGHTMELYKGSRKNTIGIAVFARGPCPDWVKPIFTLNEKWW